MRWRYMYGVSYGYCGLDGTGVSCPVGLAVSSAAS
jgi:hypothetical protein